MPARTLLWTGAVTFAFAATAHAAITITTHKTKNESCTAGVCTPTGPNANIRVKDLEKLLAHSDMKIVTGQGATSIGILDPLTWASHHRLTLDANQSIHVRAPVVVEGTGGVTLITNDGGTGGDYDFDTTTSGSLTFWDTGSSLIVNGASFTLVKDIATLASGIAANPSGNYALANGYDASADGVYANAPVQTTVGGTVEGLGNPISNLTIIAHLNNGPIYAGLFVRSAGTLRDISLNAVNISTRVNQTGYGGALAIYNDGNIAHASVTGKIAMVSALDVGGLVYANQGHIAQSSVDMTVQGDHVGGLAWTNSASGTIEASFANIAGQGIDDVGGLVTTNNGSIGSSYATGTISTQTFAGGLVDTNSGAIVLCHAAVANTANQAGGLVMFNSGRIAQSYATGPSVGAGNGGLVGALLPGGTIAQSYATGSVTQEQSSTGFEGGLVGYDIAQNGRVTISEVYSTGSVFGGESQRKRVGGLLGTDSKQGAHAQNAYWNLDTSGIDDPSRGAGHPLNDPGITGLTDAQLKSALPAGFDPNVWGQSASINNGWPYLLANPPPQ